MWARRQCAGLLGYAAFDWSDAVANAEVAAGDAIDVAVTVRNTGERAGSEIVQLYLADPVASVVRPQKRLVGYARVALEAGAAARVAFRLPTDLASFTGLGGRRVLETGDLDLHLATSSARSEAVLRVRVTGAGREYDDAQDASRALTSTTAVVPVD